MNGDMKEKMKEIRNIENKYGLMCFRMGLIHLADVGHRHLTDDNVEESIKQIIATGEENKTNGIVTIMTPEFQCNILHCAAALAKFSILTLFIYIKNHMDVSN